MTLIIYHANCQDGFCAAFIAWLHYGDQARYLAAQYGDDPPEVANEDVLIFDFSYKREQLQHMHSVAKSLRVFDHHKTAQADLEGLDYCTFDQTKSGARLAWDYFDDVSKKHFDLSWLIDYVEDRDLWRWQLPWSKELNAGLAARPMTFDMWATLKKEDLIAEGRAILRYQQQVIAKHVTAARMYSLGGWNIPFVNATTLISEIGAELAKDHTFAAMWFWDQKFIYSLRSMGDFDVSTIAHKFGGGGHKNAAGFTSNLGPWELT